MRAAELSERVAALGADVVAPEELVDAAGARGGADVVLELVGAPNLDRDLDALGAERPGHRASARERATPHLSSYAS